MSGFILCADLHLSPAENANYRWDIFRFLRLVARTSKTSTIVIAGDLVDQKDKHPAVMVDRLVGEMHALAKDHNIVLLRGNHDYQADPKVPFFGFLPLVHKNIRYVIEPMDLTIADVRCLLVPHVHGAKSIAQCTKGFALRPTNGPPSYDIILLHQTFDGARASNGQHLRGCTPSTLVSDTIGSARVYSGDIHTPQRVGNVQYIGAPYHMKFGDDFEGRVLHVTRTDETIYPFANAPKKHLLSLKLSELDTNWAADIYEEDFVRVVLSVEPDELTQVDVAKQQVRKVLDKINVLDKGIHVRLQRTVHKRRSLFSAQRESWDASSVLRRYCDAHGVSGDLQAVAEEYL